MEKNTQISTRYLTHFTKKFGSLESIIKTGFRPSIPQDGEYPIFYEGYRELREIVELKDNEKE